MSVIKNNTSESRRAARADNRTPKSVSAVGAGKSMTMHFAVTNSFQEIPVPEGASHVVFINPSSRDVELTINAPDTDFVIIKKDTAFPRVLISQSVIKVRLATGGGSDDIHCIFEG